MREIREFVENFQKTGSYRTPADRLGAPHKNGFFTTMTYHCRALLQSMARGSYLARKGKFNNERWSECGLHLLWETERLGTEVILDGFDKLRGIGPCVIVSNHMSLYETFAFPPLALAFGEIAIVLKQSLLDVPFLGRTFSTRMVIPVGRKDPRADLKEVLSQGEEFIREKKASVLLYPQGTRQPFFNVHHFNTLGIKLAMNAGVPIVPVAGQTTFLGVGKVTKDFGPIDTSVPVRFSCGEPIMSVTRANAKEAQAQCIEFIASKLEAWGKIPVIR